MLHKNYRITIGLIIILFFVQLCFFSISYSEVYYIASVFLNPKGVEDYIWVFGSDDFIHKLNKTDLEGPEVLVWDTGTSFILGGCEFRVENGEQYIYVIDSGVGTNSDCLIKFHAENGSEVSRWDISSYSTNAQGLTWNGSRWFIGDSRDDLIYQVNPNDPTVAERSFSYLGQRSIGGLTWDGSYLWVVDYGTDRAYQVDAFGNVIQNWPFTPSNPHGATYDELTNHLWIIDRSGTIHEYTFEGVLLDSWEVTSSFPKGIAYSSLIS